jgi:hypothetical protein
MLLEDRAPGFAEYLVGSIRLRLTVTVGDVDRVWLGGSRRGPDGVGCGVGQDPPGFPPHAEYRFEGEPRPGFLVLATGPHSVYYSRRVTTSLQYAVSHLHTTAPSDEHRMDYLRAMSSETGGNPFRANTEVTVRWSTANALVGRIGQLRSEVEHRFRSLVDRARQFHPIPSDLLVQPPIDVQLVDRRSDRTAPLPKIVS